MEAGPDQNSPARTQRTLSTGHTVTLPLDCEFTMAGGLFPASARRLAARLPARLSPVRVGPRTGAVALVAIEYHRVAGLEPYDEFAVIVPVAADTRTDLPGAQLLGADLGGWVHWLPVTTEASVALGREIWGYPKVVADIEIADRRGVRHATVVVDGERVVSLDVRTGETSERETTLRSYTEMDGRLLETRVDLDGPFALKPLRQGASFTLGSRERADALRELGMRRWSLGRLYASRMRARLHPGRLLGE